MLNRVNFINVSTPLTVVYHIGKEGVAYGYKLDSLDVSGGDEPLLQEVERIAIEEGKFPIYITDPTGLIVVTDFTKWSGVVSSVVIIEEKYL